MGSRESAGSSQSPRRRKGSKGASTPDSLSNSVEGWGAGKGNPVTSRSAKCSLHSPLQDCQCSLAPCPARPRSSTSICPISPFLLPILFAGSDMPWVAAGIHLCLSPPHCLPEVRSAVPSPFLHGQCPSSHPHPQRMLRRCPASSTGASNREQRL